MVSCTCDVVSPVDAVGPTHVVDALRFRHPWLDGQITIQTTNDFWQGESAPTASPYLILLKLSRWPCHPEMMQRIRIKLAEMTGWPIAGTTVRITDGNCALHGDHDVHQPVLTGTGVGWGW